MRFVHLGEALAYSFGQIHELVHGTLRDLDAAALAWRPEPGPTRSPGWCGT
jgi:hypothetical protein